MTTAYSPCLVHTCVRQGFSLQTVRTPKSPGWESGPKSNMLHVEDAERVL